jgi:hypothetical protein
MQYRKALCIVLETTTHQYSIAIVVNQALIVKILDHVDIIGPHPMFIGPLQTCEFKSICLEEFGISDELFGCDERGLHFKRSRRSRENSISFPPK